MQYNYQDLGHLPKGTRVHIDLTGNATNVRLLDGSNYLLFKSNQRHRYVGGYFDHSPIDLQVPHNDHWYVVIDYAGRAGRGHVNIQVAEPAR